MGNSTLPWGGDAGPPPSLGGRWGQGGSCPHTQHPGAISPAKRPQPWPAPTPQPGEARLGCPAPTPPLFSLASLTLRNGLEAPGVGAGDYENASEAARAGLWPNNYTPLALQRAARDRGPTPFLSLRLWSRCSPTSLPSSLFHSRPLGAPPPPMPNLSQESALLGSPQPPTSPGACRSLEKVEGVV